MSSVNTMRLNVITPDSIVFSDDIRFVVARTGSGDIGILPNHSPLVATLRIWPVKIEMPNGETHELAVFGGFIEVNANEVNIVTPNCELPEAIDLDRAKRAKERAERRLADKNTNIDIQRAQYALQRAMVRIHVGSGKGLSK